VLFRSLMHDATEKLTGITGVVAESSEVIRSSIEKIEKEITDLNRASDETCDILEKITTENTEEQKSTLEVLQQLNKVTKFVVNLNKAIDFFNVGKKIFFLFPDRARCTPLAIRIVEEEYEVFELANQKIVPKLLREYSNSILFINYSGLPEKVAVEEIVASIGKKTSLKNMLVFCLVFGDKAADIPKPEAVNFETIRLSPDNTAENENTILALLEKHKAKGLRKYIRVECLEKDNVRIKYQADAPDVQLRIINISSSAILCERKGEGRAPTGKRSGELLLFFADKEYRVACHEVVEKEENKLLFIVNLKGYPDTKHRIYSFIYQKLQEKLAEELAMIHD
jgi:hypothetical protein